MKEDVPLFIYTRLETNLISLEELNELFIEDLQLNKLNRLDNIIIQLDVKLSLVDFCYQLSKKNRLDSTEAYVVDKSLLLNHKVIVKSVLSIVNRMHQDLKQKSTIYDCCKYILSYIRWSIKEGFPKTPDQAKLSFSNYLHYLRNEMALYDKPKKLGISSLHARARQKSSLLFLAEMFNESCDKVFFENGVQLISENPNQFTSGKAISNEKLTKQFTFYTQLFRQLTNILLTPETIPSKITLLDKPIWLAPYASALFTKTKKGGAAFNYKDGHFYSIEELCSSYAIKKHKANSILAKGNDAFKRAQKVDSKVRQLLIGYSLKAYFMHFLFLTGMNDSSAARIFFYGDYEFSKNSMLFTSVKMRANGKKVKFEIQTEFKDDFKLYLKLRKHVLENFSHTKNESDRLFLASVERKVRIHPLQGGASYKSRKSLSSAFNIDFLDATSSIIRLSKGIWIRKAYGSTVSAWVLQHSAKTNIRNYSGNDDETTSNEMNSFFSTLSDNIKGESNITNTSIGRCSDFEKPRSSNIDTVESNCSKLETCLFCDNYRIHSDELDIHKLLSLKYLIIEGQTLAFNSEHFISVFNIYLNRIEEILDEMRGSTPEKVALIESISNKVFNQGMLTPYWQSKLELYIDLGVL